MITVIMLTCDREAMLSGMIEDILGQTLRDFEFIIVDNGSTDRSGAIAEDYAARDGRVRVIHRKRGGIGAGRNTGLDAAKGEYIAFVDDDDRAERDYLEFLLGLLEEAGADAAICGTPDRVFPEKRLLCAEESVIALSRRKLYNIALPAKLFRRELFLGERFPAERPYDDIAVTYRLLAAAERVAFHGLPKYRFVRHSNNMSAWTTDYRLLTPGILEEYLRAYRERTAWLSGRFPDSAAAFRYFEWSFQLSMVEKIERFGLTDCAAQLARLKGELRACRHEFLASPELQQFEREWVERYL